MTEYLKKRACLSTRPLFILTALHVDLVTFPATHDQCRSILKVISIVITERDNGRPVLTDITVMFFGKDQNQIVLGAAHPTVNKRNQLFPVAVA